MADQSFIMISDGENLVVSDECSNTAFICKDIHIKNCQIEQNFNNKVEHCFGSDVKVVLPSKTKNDLNLNMSCSKIEHSTVTDINDFLGKEIFTILNSFKKAIKEKEENK